MATDSYILIGGSEHARVTLDVLLSTGASVHALFDPKLSGELFGVPQAGEYQPELYPGAKAIVAIGDNATRSKVVKTCRHAFGRVIHSTALVSKYGSVEEGAMIFHGAIIQAQSTIGKHVIINTGARVDHDCLIGDFVHIAPSATLCGTVHVGEGTLIGAAAVVIPGIKIGKWAVIGAGTVVTKDVPDHAVVVGVPSRIVKILTK